MESLFSPHGRAALLHHLYVRAMETGFVLNIQMFAYLIQLEESFI